MREECWPWELPSAPDKWQHSSNTTWLTIITSIYMYTNCTLIHGYVGGQLLHRHVHVHVHIKVSLYGTKAPIARDCTIQSDHMNKTHIYMYIHVCTCTLHMYIMTYTLYDTLYECYIGHTAYSHTWMVGAGVLPVGLVDSFKCFPFTISARLEMPCSGGGGGGGGAAGTVDPPASGGKCAGE